MYTEKSCYYQLAQSQVTTSHLSQPLTFIYGKVTYKEFSDKFETLDLKYQQRDGLGKTVILSIWVTAKVVCGVAALSFKWILSFGISQPNLKMDFFHAKRNAQELYGRIISLFYVKKGLYHIQESQFQKLCYSDGLRVHAFHELLKQNTYKAANEIQKLSLDFIKDDLYMTLALNEMNKVRIDPFLFNVSGINLYVSKIKDKKLQTSLSIQLCENYFEKAGQNFKSHRDRLTKNLLVNGLECIQPIWNSLSALSDPDSQDTLSVNALLVKWCKKSIQEEWFSYLDLCLQEKQKQGLAYRTVLKQVTEDCVKDINNYSNRSMAVLELILSPVNSQKKNEFLQILFPIFLQANNLNSAYKIIAEIDPKETALKLSFFEALINQYFVVNDAEANPEVKIFYLKTAHELVYKHTSFFVGEKKTEKLDILYCQLADRYAAIEEWGKVSEIGNLIECEEKKRNIFLSLIDHHLGLKDNSTLLELIQTTPFQDAAQSIAIIQKYLASCYENNDLLFVNRFVKSRVGKMIVQNDLSKGEERVNLLRTYNQWELHLQENQRELIKAALITNDMDQIKQVLEQVCDQVKEAFYVYFERAQQFEALFIQYKQAKVSICEFERKDLLLKAQQINLKNQKLGLENHRKFKEDFPLELAGITRIDTTSVIKIAEEKLFETEENFNRAIEKYQNEILRLKQLKRPEEAYNFISEHSSEELEKRYSEKS